MHTRPMILALCFGFFSPARGAEFEGAAKLLERLEAGERARAGVEGDPHTVLKEKLARYREQLPQMNAEAQAGGWLDLFDGYLAIPYGSGSARPSSELVTKESLMYALPPSSTWEAMAVKIAGRKDSPEKVALELMMRLLRGTPDDTDATMGMVGQALERANRGVAPPAEMMASLEKALEWRMGRRAVHKTTLLESLEMLGKDGAEDYLTISRNDLVRPDADALLARALKSGVALACEDDVVAARIKNLILKDPALLKKPLWDLVSSREDAPLYEAMLSRFPEPVVEKLTGPEASCIIEDSFGSYMAARALHLGALPALGREDEARREIARYLEDGWEVNDIPFGPIGEKETGLVETVKFLENVLGTAPCFSEWRSYAYLASKAGRGAESLEFMKKALAFPEIGKGGRDALLAVLSDRLWEAGERDAAVDLLKKRMKVTEKSEALEIRVEDLSLARTQLKSAGIEISEGAVRRMMLRSAGSEWSLSRSLSGELLAKGRLAHRPEWVEEGLSFAMAAEQRQDMSFLSDQIGEFLIKVGRLPELEKRYVARLEMLTRESVKDSYEVNKQLMNLVELYKMSGRWGDIVILLDRFPYWRSGDLGGALGSGWDANLALIAAEAFQKTRNHEVADALLERCLQVSPQMDELYPLLLRAGGADLESRLDETVNRNPFLVYPLICKAEVQLGAGRLEAAEKTIRRAIDVAPSEIRAQKVLGEILEKAGVTGGSVMARAKVAAHNRTAEALELRGADLLKEAAAKLEEAVKMSPNFRPAQGWLARVYEEMGEATKAREHKIRAAELLPTYWDQVADSDRLTQMLKHSESEWELEVDVLSKMAVAQPENAKVFYALGETQAWRDEEKEAAVAFRRALEIDPDFLAAWSALHELNLQKDAGESDAIIFNLIRLNHYLPDTIQSGHQIYASDLARFRDLLIAKHAAAPVVPNGPIYRLAAVKPGRGQGRESERNWERDEFVTHPSVEVLMEVMGHLTGKF